MSSNSTLLAARCAHLPEIMDYLLDLYEPYKVIESTMSDEDLYVFTKIHVLNYLLRTALDQCFYEGTTELLYKENDKFVVKEIQGLVPAQFILERLIYEIYNPNVWLKKTHISQEVLNENGHIKNRADKIDEAVKRTLFTCNIKEKSFSYDVYKITFEILAENFNFYEDWFKNNDKKRYFEASFKRAIDKNKSVPYSVTHWVKKLEILV